MYILQSKVY